MNIRTQLEVAMARVPQEPAHPIPPMTHPYGKHWEQPDRFAIEIDATHALMSQQTFGRLADYSHSQPTGVYEGKMWVSQYQDGWWLHWFGPADEPDQCRREGRRILVV